MTQIVLEPAANGWRAQRMDCWDKLGVTHVDREQALLKLLSLMHIEVVTQADYWVNGECRLWCVSNQESA